MIEAHYQRLAQLRTPEQFAAHVRALGVELPFDPEPVAGPASALAAQYALRDRTIGNRFAVLPMEGWDGTHDGRASDLTLRRWRRFGVSGAKLVWGGEAVAVRHDGRANPNQLLIAEHTLSSLEMLRHELVQAHAEVHANVKDLWVGLQLTHSGRYSRPNRKDRLEPRLAYSHPLLNQRLGLPAEHPVLTDGQLDDLVGDFVRAAVWSQRLGFDFVDIKHCHGYLGHELLSAVDRPGRYGGSLENRTRFLREVVAGVRRDAPGLDIGVRVSIFDTLPFHGNPNERGARQRIDGRYPYAFGADADDPSQPDLREPIALLEMLENLGIALVCLTAGSPYYNPHVQRPALFPPSDSYLPPEDPLVGVARQLAVTAELKARFPRLAIVGSAYSYLQEWLPHVAQHNVRTGRVDFVGLGRMMLAYPELPADLLAGRPLQTRRLCRTFSDCTSGPRNGLVSGCFPLDPFYKAHPDRERLMEIKKSVVSSQ